MKALALAMLLGLIPVATMAAPVQTYVEAPGPMGALKGTMLAPSPSAGAILIIPGSGPTDRDGNSPAGVRASTYKLLAEGLAAKGLTTVRIDKRGMFASAGAIADANAVTIGDYADDVHSWVSVIREKTGASCVWLLGHSEGGLVALSASQGASDICGLILVATAGRPLGEVLREQLKANPANAPILSQALPAIDALEAGRHVDVSNMNRALLPLFAPRVQDFLINVFSLDPARMIAGYPGPVLILQGERDLQVGVPDAEVLKKANAKARLVLLTGTNHLLKTVNSADRAANFATYADPSLPLASGVIDAIAGFVIAPQEVR